MFYIFTISSSFYRQYCALYLIKNYQKYTEHITLRFISLSTQDKAYMKYSNWTDFIVYVAIHFRMDLKFIHYQLHNPA